MQNFSLKAKLIALAITLNFSVAIAQDEISESQLRYGPKIGFTISKFNNSQPHTGSITGYTVGAFLEYSYNEKLAIQIEPAYLQQGGRFVRFSDDSRFGTGSIYELYTTNSRITLHNLDLPILAKYRLPKLGEFQPNVVLGPAVTYTLSATNNYETTFYENQTFNTVSAKRNQTSQYEPFTLGVTGGIGGEVNIGSRSLLIDLRYRYGITPAKKGYSYIDLYDVQGDLKTHTVYLSIGLTI